MKQKFIEPFMQTAETFAKLSTAKRLKVGCVVVKENRIISIGYNGTPTGWDNTCEHEIPEQIDVENRTVIPARLVTKQEVHHAERNALDKIARSNESSEGSSLFVTHAPCIECAKSIYACGIREVFYRHDYKASVGSGLEFLKKAGVEIHKVVQSTE